MSTAFCEVSESAPPVCLLPWQENPYRLVTLWDMYQIYAHNLMRLFDELRDLEIKLSTSLREAPDPADAEAVSNQFFQRLASIQHACEGLQLSSSQKQVRHIIEKIAGKTTSGLSLSPMLEELRRRIREDLEDHVYFCIPEQIASKCFAKDAHGLYQFKVPSELMDSRVVEAFPPCSDDIEQAYRCFVFGCYTASMFHLMRVVEVAVLRIGQLVGLKDPSPSWGSVLSQVEKVVLKTKYEDMEEAVRPHRKLLRALLPQMQAIQRAWRNKFSHVEYRIIPADGELSESIAAEILTAVEGLMRQLSRDLPAEV